MKVYYFCACIPVLRIRGAWGKGRLCHYGTERIFHHRVCLAAVLLFFCMTTAAGMTTAGMTAAGNTSSNGLASCDSLQDYTPKDCTLQNFSHMSDSVPADRFRVRQLILPTALIAVGTFGVYNGWFGSVRTNLRDDIGHMRGNCYFHADDYLQYLPVAANVTMGMLGVKSRHSLKERLAVTATAYIAMGIIVNAGKYTVKERRPDSSARNSFPSGHTATAFMGAELVREEYGGICGWSAYAVATGIAALRLYNERHWLNDVIAGAGVGILSARIGYWLLPAERHLFGWHDSNVAILPVVNTSGYYGLAMNIEF